MDIPKIFESEYRFCLILWANEPVRSPELVELCREQLGWSKATTYTVIRRLAQRGVLVNEQTVVRSLVSKAQAQQSRLDALMQDTFEDSFPAFLAAFSQSQRIRDDEAKKLQAIIAEFEEESPC